MVWDLQERRPVHTQRYASQLIAGSPALLLHACLFANMLL